MKMFYNSKRQRIWDDFARNLFYANERAGHVMGKMSRDEIVECDTCGSLLRKDNRWKTASTIETRMPPKRYEYNVLAQAAFGEYIVEHYICGRCRLPTDAKGESLDHKEIKKEET